MRVLFTGALGDFIGAESFITEQEKDAVTEVLWATRNRLEILSAVDIMAVFPNLQKQTILFDDFCDERPTRPWRPGDRFMNIGDKSELNLKCGLNLSQQELNSISDHSLDATLRGIFSGERRFATSRITTRMALPDISNFNLPNEYVVIHPWSDAEVCGREFNTQDWNNIFKFLERRNLIGVVVNKSNVLPPSHNRIIDLTNKTSLKETFAIIKQSSYAILCSSSLACYASKILPKGKIWLKGGHEFIFTDWATYFYHGPFIDPKDIVFRDLEVINPSNSMINLDQGYITLL